MKPSLAISAQRAAIIEIVLRHHARNPKVFGSTARSEDTEQSDLDILVEPDPGMTLMDIGAIRHELQEILGVRVDVLTPAGLPAEISVAALKDLQPL